MTNETEIFNISDSVFDAGRQRERAEIIDNLEREIDNCSRHFDDQECRTCSGLAIAIEIAKGKHK